MEDEKYKDKGDIWTQGLGKTSSKFGVKTTGEHSTSVKSKAGQCSL